MLNFDDVMSQLFGNASRDMGLIESAFALRRMYERISRTGDVREEALASSVFQVPGEIKELTSEQDIIRKLKELTEISLKKEKQKMDENKNLLALQEEWESKDGLETLREMRREAESVLVDASIVIDDAKRYLESRDVKLD